MYEKVSTKLDFTSREEKVLEFWKENKVFEKSIEEKKAFLLSHGIALWDVLGSCDIRGSSDSSIRNAVPNDVGPIAAQVQAIFCNGQTAFRLYGRFLEPALGRPAIPLPSTSPANAAWSPERLTDAWRAALGPALDL